MHQFSLCPLLLFYFLSSKLLNERSAVPQLTDWGRWSINELIVFCWWCSATSLRIRRSSDVGRTAISTWALSSYKPMLSGTHRIMRYAFTSEERRIEASTSKPDPDSMQFSFNEVRECWLLNRRLEQFSPVSWYGRHFGIDSILTIMSPPKVKIDFLLMNWITVHKKITKNGKKKNPSDTRYKYAFLTTRLFGTWPFRWLAPWLELLSEVWPREKILVKSTRILVK